MLSRGRSRSGRREIWAALLSLALGACTRPAAPATPPAAPGAASIAHWDPTTGRFVEPPPSVARSLATAPPVPLAPLREEDSPRGGRMVRLGNRFRHHAAASLGPDGRATSACDLAPG